MVDERRAPYKRVLFTSHQSQTLMAIDLNQRINFTYGEPRELEPGVARVVANNPSPFTFKGTNTYILGTRTLAVIDPGPDDEAHYAAILRAVAGRPVSHIVLTHAHGDHADGIPRLQSALDAPLAAYGYEGRDARGSPDTPRLTEAGSKSVRPDIVLRDRSVIEGDGWKLEAIFTPGHMPDHLCFALDGPDFAQKDILFSGDHVMAWNTSVVAPPDGNMGDYLASLERLRGRNDRLYLPGHGGKLATPERMVRAYLIHRRMREEAILNTIRERPRTITEIVAVIYPTIDPKLVRAASLSAQAHVEHLMSRALVACDGPLTWDRQLYPA